MGKVDIVAATRSRARRIAVAAGGAAAAGGRAGRGGRAAAREEEEGALRWRRAPSTGPSPRALHPPEAVRAARRAGPAAIAGLSATAGALPERVWLRVPDELDRRRATRSPGRRCSRRSMASPQRRPRRRYAALLSSARTPRASSPFIPPPRPQPSCSAGPRRCGFDSGGGAARGGRLRLRGDAVDGAAALRAAPGASTAACGGSATAQRPLYRSTSRAAPSSTPTPPSASTAPCSRRTARWAPRRSSPPPPSVDGPWCFVSPSDDDLGLFARVDLGVGRPSASGGRASPPGAGACCSSPARRPSSTPRAALRTMTCRASATFVMHSGWPNAPRDLGRRAGRRAPPSCAADVARRARADPAGGEIRIDYGGSRAARGGHIKHASIEAERKTPTGAPSGSPRRRPPPPSASSTA